MMNITNGTWPGDGINRRSVTVLIRQLADRLFAILPRSPELALLFAWRGGFATRRG